MTGGVAVILGPTGRNFGAGMSGGIAYVLDPSGEFRKKCNNDSLNLFTVAADSDILELKELVENHYNATQSPRAKRVLESWESYLPKFVKVFPEEYRQALLRLENEQLETS
jgi:glutamate synthase (ferredoxin)